MKRGRPLSKIISDNRIIIVRGTDKGFLFQKLAQAAATELESVSAEQVNKSLWVREHLLSTRLGTNVAMPHAQLEESVETVVILALCPDGIQYDARVYEPVHLVFCITGEETNHLETLSSIAAALRLPALLDSLVDAGREAAKDRVLSILNSKPVEGLAHADSVAVQRQMYSRQIWRNAVQLAPLVGAACILLHLQPTDAANYRVPAELSRKLFLLTPEDLGIASTSITGAGRAGSGLSIVLLYALTEQRIQSDDIIINVFGSRDPTALDTIQVIDVKSEFRSFFSVSRELSLTASAHRAMLRVVELAAELAAEGREGKSVGALFVIGDTAEVQAHCQQMLMNPFKGYDQQQRNVLDPGLTETIKELSRIDGAFIITDEGVIESAGTYLRVDADLPELLPGLGARHAAAASITAVSKSVAVAISESTRQVSVFRHGRRVVVM